MSEAEMLEDANDWLIAQLKPHGLLRARLNVARQGYRAFMPLLKAKPVRGKAARPKPKPLFPGYLFIKTDSPDLHWRHLNSTFGISRLIMSRPHHPAVLPENFARLLLSRCDENEIYSPLPSFQPGDRVALIGGPFAGQIADIESLSDSGRVHVLLDILGRAVRAEIGLDQLDVVAQKRRGNG